MSEEVAVYTLAEKFKSVQGEGQYAGTPMAFFRFVGCSVGKKVCHACDTDFEKVLPWLGGGEMTALEIIDFAEPYKHICLTGGEPFDQDVEPIFSAASGQMIHLETSGTLKLPHFIAAYQKIWNGTKAWVCCSPKPGFLEETVLAADEVKVVVPGLGSGAGWPTLEDAKRWASFGKKVYLQPRNGKHTIDVDNLAVCEELVAENPELRLSVQLHKLLKVR
jgi:organic radical activating enzyme